MKTKNRTAAGAINATMAAVMALQGGAACAQTVLRTATLAFPSPAGEPTGTWSGNSLITLEGASSGAPVLHIHDQSGAEAQRVTFQIPGASLVNIYDSRFARSKEGYLAVAGTAYGPAALGANFVAVIAPNGSSQVVIRTSPYAPHALTFAADGTIWVAGLDNREGAGDDYFIIRRFDSSGKPLGGAVPRRLFPSGPSPANASKLVASKDRVGWFAPMAHRYMEFSLDGKELATYQSSVSFEDVDGIALCDDNSVWVSSDADPDAKKTPMKKPGFVPRSILTRLDRASGTWSARATRSFTYLYGCSGTTLVAASGSLDQVVWMAMP